MHPEDNYSKICKHFVSLLFVILLRTVSISQLDLNAESNKGSARKSGDSHPPENFSRGLYDIWQHCQPQMILCQLPDLF